MGFLLNYTSYRNKMSTIIAKKGKILFSPHVLCVVCCVLCFVLCCVLCCVCEGQ